MNTRYLPGRPIVAQTLQDTTANRTPPSQTFRLPMSEEMRSLYKIEKRAALKRLLALLRFLGLTILVTGAVLMALTFANKINVKVTLTVTTLPPCYEQDKLDLWMAKQYLQRPMKAYVPFNICSSGDVDILVVVQSNIKNGNLRQMMRNTWGSQQFLKEIKNRSVEVMFVLDPVLSRMPKEVAYEMIDHSDILLPMPTRFFTKTIGRSIATYQWIAHFCPHAKFVVNIADSVDISIPVLLNFTLRVAQMQRTMFGFIKNSLAGKAHILTKILNGSDVHGAKADELAKFKEYAHEDAYILTGDTIRPMCTQASKTATRGMAAIDNENITVTGIWPTDAGIHLYDVCDSSEK